MQGRFQGISLIHAAANLKCASIYRSFAPLLKCNSQWTAQGISFAEQGITAILNRPSAAEWTTSG
jgi:hypothetical protein